MSTLSDILTRVAAYINQDPTLPTGTDLSMWTSLVTQSQDEWADSYVWRKQLQRRYEVPVVNSMVSIGLPDDYDRLDSPIFDASYSGNNRYFEIQPQDRFLKDPTDKFFCKYGSNASGWHLEINPPLPSGASITIDYVSHPVSLVSLTDPITCQSDQFLVLRTISKVLSARSDPRFTIVFQESVTLLQHMMDDEASPDNARDNQTPTWMDRKQFRIGDQ
jgi:hypothetical protein